MPREARYRAIARELAQRIDSGDLPPGSRLPTEDALAEQYGVHRLTARQAMVELRTSGLVETRQAAAAMYVCSSAGWRCRSIRTPGCTGRRRSTNSPGVSPTASSSSVARCAVTRPPPRGWACRTTRSTRCPRCCG
ncbi:winged helix-turn-helix transcriptional regulator [Streptacidiphilus sp. 4-A2]|nr:winged helix-turn-helix transcriptional regulator [Streptacidiphilus sp. 4-A2]